MGGRLASRRQGLGADEADIAVPAGLAPGPAVLEIQHLEAFAMEQFVLPLGCAVRRLEDGRRRPRAPHCLGGGEALGADQALQPDVGEVRPGQKRAAVPAHG